MTLFILSMSAFKLSGLMHGKIHNLRQVVGMMHHALRYQAMALTVTLLGLAIFGATYAICITLSVLSAWRAWCSEPPLYPCLHRRVGG